MDHLPLPSSPQMGFILFSFHISASNPVNHQILIAFWQQAEMRGLNTDICPDNDMKREEKKKTKNMQHPPGVRERKQQGEVPSPHQRMLQILSEGTEALSSGQALPRLWHIWVMRFTSRPLDLVQKRSATAHTQCGIHSPLERRRVVLHYALDRCQFNALTWLSCLLFPHVHYSLRSINYNHDTGPVYLTTTVWLQRFFKRGCMTCRRLVNREANYEAHDLNTINARIDTSITSLQAYDSQDLRTLEPNILKSC